MLQPEFAEYPDSGKIVAAAGGPLAPGEEALLELPLRKDDAVGYWQGSRRTSCVHTLHAMVATNASRHAVVGVVVLVLRRIGIR